MTRVEPTLRFALPLLTLAWAAFLFWVSTSTRGAEAVIGASPDPFDRLVGPVAHLGGYGVLASLLVLWIWVAWPRIAALRAPLAAAFVAATAYGAALELYQTTLSARAGTWGDVAVNATGAAAALTVLTVARRWRGGAALR